MYHFAIGYYVLYYLVFLRLCYLIYIDRNVDREWIYVD